MIHPFCGEKAYASEEEFYLSYAREIVFSTNRFGENTRDTGLTSRDFIFDMKSRRTL